MKKSGETPEAHIANDLLADESSPPVEIKEEMVVKVMQELWKEINSGYSADRRINLDINFSQPPASVSRPSSYCDVGGDNERCGSVFSEASSTVMAGVGLPAGAGNFVVGRDLCCDCNTKKGGAKMNGGDDNEVDDEWLASVLSMDLQEFDDLEVDPVIDDTRGN